MCNFMHPSEAPTLSISPTLEKCIDVPGWLDQDFDNCNDYASNLIFNWCNTYGTFYIGTYGLTAMQACCGEFLFCSLT